VRKNYSEISHFIKFIFIFIFILLLFFICSSGSECEQNILIEKADEEFFSVAIDPFFSHQFVVGGSSTFVRLFDDR
jgi:hypothetical protein